MKNFLLHTTLTTDSFLIIYLALKRVVSFSVRTTLCCLFPTTLNISSIYFYMSSVMMSSVSNPFICFWRRATSFACLTASLWHTHRTCFWFLSPPGVSQLVLIRLNVIYLDPISLSLTPPDVSQLVLIRLNVIYLNPISLSLTPPGM
jgi:hypothetical protein